VIAAALEALALALGPVLMARIRTVPADTAGAGAWPPVTVIVPARNEEDTLPALLGSLARQRAPAHQVVVVDDGSADRTAEVARAFGADLVEAAPLPPGWTGKPWACRTGAAAATGRVLVFLDADTALSDDGLARVVRAHSALAGDGLLSVQPFHHTRRGYEQLSAFPNVVSMMATGAFAAGRWSPPAVAFGPCMVTTRTAYDAVGGHTAVRGEVVEDLKLAQAYRSGDRPVCCLAGGDAVGFRMYAHGITELVEGWTKNLAAGSGMVPVLPAVAATAWVAACVAAATGTGAALLAAVRGDDPSWWWAGAWLAVAIEMRWMLGRIGAFRPWAAWCFPIPLGAFVALFARSASRRLLRRPVRWRGRQVHAAVRRR